MITMDFDSIAESDRHFINIRDVTRNYTTSFWLENGKDLTIHYPDGTSISRKCSYLDMYHFNFGFNCYHIDQFAEVIAQNKAVCSPSEYVTDLSVYRKFYADREFKDADGKPIPYRSIIGINPDIYNDPKMLIAVCPEALYDRQVAFRELQDDGIPQTTFYSIAEARSKLLPKLNLPIHEQKLLYAVFDVHEREIIHISKKDFDAIPSDYKGVYKDFDNAHPEWKGRKTAFLPGHGTALFIEGVSFVIDDIKKLSLEQQMNLAINKSENNHNQLENQTQQFNER